LIVDVSMVDADRPQISRSCRSSTQHNQSLDVYVSVESAVLVNWRQNTLLAMTVAEGVEILQFEIELISW